MIRRSKTITITLVFMIIGLSYLQASFVSGETNLNSSPSFSLSSKRFSSFNYFITIINDQNFTDYGFPGSGTEEDPFRIENYTLELSEHYANGIAVINTTKHFIIQNCFLVADWSAIIFENVAPGTAIIQNNTCHRSDVGIGLIRSNNVQIVNNTCWDFNNYGIFLYYSNYTLVSKNNCYRNKASGIHSELSSANIYEFNNCSDNSNFGIRLLYDTNSTVKDNICNNGNRGAFLGTRGSNIKNNFFNNNSDYGLRLVFTYNSSLTDNSFSFNRAEGIQTGDVGFCNFTFNLFENNAKHGITFDFSTYENLIHHNRFTNNKPSGSSQAYDSGTNNIWFEQETQQGNYWSEWNRRKPYLIDGSANSQDLYPLDNFLVRINFHFLVSILCFPIIAIVKLSKRRRIL